MMNSAQRTALLIPVLALTSSALLVRAVENKAQVVDVPSAAGNDSQLPTSADDRAASDRDRVVRRIEGFTVHVDPTLLGGVHAEKGAKALQMLANHLQRISILVPAAALAKLQTIEICLDHDHPRLSGMQYHPSREWLVGNGHDAHLAKKVHICRAAQLLSREQMLKHPAVVLHELAHGFHDQFLSFDNPQIIAAFDHAKASGSYDKVLFYTGQYVSHYGRTDHKEYFAEGTEAYFYRNDFYPFVRAELQLHDPTLHSLLKTVWEEGDAPAP